MAHRFVEVDQPRPPVINHIETPELPKAGLIFATGNQRKLDEFARILGEPVEGKKLSIDEIQVDDPRDWQKVAEDKAIVAWEANNRQPIIVEDTSLEVFAWDGRPGVFADQFTGDRNARQSICDIARQKNDRRTIARVTLALFDGKEVHLRVGETSGTISEFPRGSEGFGWDDIFEPDGQEVLDNWSGTRRTFAEMTGEEKDILSMRTRALLELKENPFQVGQYIFAMPEPYEMQLRMIKPEVLQDAKARGFAYALEAIRGSEPNKDGSVGKRQPYYRFDLGPGITRYTPFDDSQYPGLGIITTPMDLVVDMHGRPKRLDVTNDGNPIFYAMNDGAVKMALESRAVEFQLHHNEQMYEMLRDMMRGEITTPSRTNRRQPVVEELLGMTVWGDNPITSVKEFNSRARVLSTAALEELGYTRNFSRDKVLSRSSAANTGLIINSQGSPNSLRRLPHSIFALGGMPPVTGWRDVLATAALSYMDCYIPRNSIYAGNPDRQIRLFQSAKEVIEGLSLPKDITRMVLDHIGISLGCDDPQKIEELVREISQAGCRLFRIYTTNPDQRVPQTAEAIRQQVGENGRICVGPVVSLDQAGALISSDINVDILLPGHGAGENCTSLEGGGAANGLEIVYAMSLIPDFNKVTIGFEGGVGYDFGGLLGMVDLISMGRKGVASGIELGGLFVQHSNGEMCFPYHGSASPVTQWIEVYSNPDIAARRVDHAGRLKNNEGKPNYAFSHRSVRSITDNLYFLRTLAGRILSDLGVSSIVELREEVQTGRVVGQRIITPKAKEKALAHRGE